MDNFKMFRKWEDGNIVEINVEAKNNYVDIKQTCYVTYDLLTEYANRIKSFITSVDRNMYLEFGKISGDYTPSFSIEIIKIDTSGHIKLDLNMENEDDETRKHRCGLFVNTELGLLESFSKQMIEFAKKQREVVTLNGL